MNDPSTLRPVEAPHISADELRYRVTAALDQTHRDLIAIRCTCVGLIYIVLGVLNYFAFSADIALTLAVMAVLTGIIFLAFAVFHRVQSYPNHMTNWFIFGEMLVLQGDGMVFLILTYDIMNSYGIFVIIVGAGLFISRFSWLVVNIVVVAVSWAATLLVFGFEVRVEREVLMLVSSIVAALMFFYLRYKSMEKLTVAQMGQESYQRQLELALQEIETLSGLLPICASCKNIRDDTGAWHAVETYVRDHSSAEFTHSLCPDCIKQYHPDS